MQYGVTVSAAVSILYPSWRNHGFILLKQSFSPLPPPPPPPYERIQWFKILASKWPGCWSTSSTLSIRTPSIQSMSNLGVQMGWGPLAKSNCGSLFAFNIFQCVGRQAVVVAPDKYFRWNLLPSVTSSAEHGCSSFLRNVGTCPSKSTGSHPGKLLLLMTFNSVWYVRISKA